MLTSAVSLPYVDWLRFENQNSSELITEQNADFYSEQVFSEALRQENVNFEKLFINVYTNKQSDGSIVINRVEIYSDQDAAIIKRVIGSKDYEVVVINE